AGGQDQGDRRQRGSLLGELAERHAQVLTDSSRSRRVFYSRGAASGAATPAQSKGRLGRLQDKVADLTGYRSIDDLLYSWQDKFIDLKRIQEHIKALNGTVSETNDAYRGEELYHKRVAKRAGNFLRDEVRPLLKRMNEAKVAIEALERFLHARHAPEANRVMAERNPGAQQLQAQRDAAAKTVEDLRRQLQRAQALGMATGPVQKALGQALIDQDRWNGAESFAGTEEERLSLSGMSDAEAKAIMDGYSPEQRQVLDELAARVDRINDGTLKTLESYGLMDQATLSAWRKTYQHYVPLHRDEAHPDSKAHPIGQGFSTKGDASKRRTGSNERVTNILSHIVMQREAALTRGEKNNVVKRMYLLAAQNPDKELWSLELPKKKALEPDTGLVKTMVDQGAKARDNVVTVRIGGKDRYIVFNERNEKAVRLAIAMKNHGRHGTGPLHSDCSLDHAVVLLGQHPVQPCVRCHEPGARPAGSHVAAVHHASGREASRGVPQHPAKHARHLQGTAPRAQGRGCAHRPMGAAVGATAARRRHNRLPRPVCRSKGPCQSIAEGAGPGWPGHVGCRRRPGAAWLAVRLQ
ncbi:MAG: hypothetical protein ACN6OP_05155, partial [Pseudomonadales bacterium]